MDEMKLKINELFNIPLDIIVPVSSHSAITTVSAEWIATIEDLKHSSTSQKEDGNGDLDKKKCISSKSIQAYKKEQQASELNSTSLLSGNEEFMKVVISVMKHENVIEFSSQNKDSIPNEYEKSFISNLLSVSERNLKGLTSDVVSINDQCYCNSELKNDDKNTNQEDPNHASILIADIHGVEVAVLMKEEEHDSKNDDEDVDGAEISNQDDQRESELESVSNLETNSMIPSHKVKTHSNLKAVIFAIATGKELFLVSTYPIHTVHEALMYSPALIQPSTMKPLFILYQILHFLRHFQTRYGLDMSMLHWEDIELDKHSWIHVHLPSACYLGSMEEGINEKSQDEDLKINKIEEETQRKMGLKVKQLPDVLDKWICGEMSNFDYLMFLNELSGRTEDPNHHAVLPWVSSLETENNSWRDLTKSKYRLNKGDDQLDLQYSMMHDISGGKDAKTRFRANNLPQVPHHVPEFLSDITYYVYMARRTSQEVLCKLVRSYWEPNEYPASVQRMQTWTPDECIPEFFTDPLVFKSIHEDMADLAVPDWCKDAEEFINKHRAMLESDIVSRQLHHWIDLNFGYKLQGKEAIEAKNVCLPLVDNHTKRVSRGIIQLFHCPHPRRRCADKDLANKLPIELGIIEGELQLPLENDPLKELHELEKLLKFKTNTWNRLENTSTLKQALDNARSDICSSGKQEQIISDRNIVAFICLTVELYLSAQIRIKRREIPLAERFQKCIQCYKLHKPLLPSGVFYALEYFANNLRCSEEKTIENLKQSSNPENCSAYSSIFKTISDRGLPPPTPTILLSPYIHVLSFPPYFAELYEVIDMILVNTHHYSQPLTDPALELVSNNIRKLFGKLHFPVECLELLTPHIQQLLQQPVNAATEFLLKNFDTVSKAMGPVASFENIFPFILKLYSSSSRTKSESSISRMKSSKIRELYRESFLLQLNTRLGIKNFLENLPRCLAEALVCDEDEVGGVAESAKQSICWLMQRIGPTLTSKHIVRHLFRVLNQCFMLVDDLTQQNVDLSQQHSVLDCLVHAAALFGPSFISLQYFAHLIYNVSSSVNGAKFTLRNQAAIEASVAAVTHFVTYLDDSTLMEQLTRLTKEIIIPIIHLLAKRDVSFHGGSKMRKSLCSKIIHTMALIVIRIGREMSRENLTSVFQTFFGHFSDLPISSSEVQSGMKQQLNTSVDLSDLDAVVIHHDEDTRTYKVGDTVVLENPSQKQHHLHASWFTDSPCPSPNKVVQIPRPYNGDKMDSSSSMPPPSDPQKEISSTFCPETAYCAYIAFTRLLGNIHMEKILGRNHDHIWKLSSQHESTLGEEKEGLSLTSQSTFENRSDDTDITMVGNRIIVGSQSSQSEMKMLPETNLDIMTTLLTSSGGMHAEGQLDESARRTLPAFPASQLSENWLAYWEHEIGLPETDRHIHFNQIELQNFSGHNNAVRCLALDQSEEWFLSGGKDKTVKIWSLCRSAAMESKRESQVASCSPRFTYKGHKKTVSYVGIVESERVIMSNDGTLHVWDPYTGQQVLVFDGSDIKAGVAIATTLPAPQRYALVVTNENNLKVVDFRRKILAHEFKTTASTSVGIVRSMCTSTDGQWVAIGYSSGVVTILDVRMGTLLSMRPAHEADISTMCSVSNSQFLTASADQSVALWETGNSTPSAIYRSYQEPVHVVQLFNDEIITASVANRVTVHSLPGEYQVLEGNTDAKSTFDKPVAVSKLRSDSFRGVLSTLAVLTMKRQLLIASDNGNIKLMA